MTVSALLTGVLPVEGASPPAPVGGQVGTVDTVAGPGFCRGSATPDRASTTVRALAVDGDGRTHVDTGSPGAGVVGRVERDGSATLVRPGSLLPAGSGGDGERAGGSPPARLAPDGSGGVLIAAGARIVQVNFQGGPALLAGDPGPVPQPAGAADVDPTPVARARFVNVRSLASDGEGNVYLAEELDAVTSAVRIRFLNRGRDPVTFYPGTPHEVTVPPGTIDTLAGGREPGDAGEGGRAGVAGGRADPDAGDGGPARLAAITGTPPALAVVGSRLYVGLSSGAGAAKSATSVRVVNLGGERTVAHGRSLAPGAIDTVSGGGKAGYGGDGGQARDAALSYVSGLAADPDGSLYLADQDNHRIRKVDPSGVITTFAGTGPVGASGGGFNGNDQPASQARLNRPYDVKLGPGGEVYVSDHLNHQVRVISKAGLIRTAAGNGIGSSWVCPPDDPAARAEPPRPGGPVSLTTDAKGTTYIGFLSRDGVIAMSPSAELAGLPATLKEAAPCPPGPVCPPQPPRNAAVQGGTGVSSSPAGGLYVTAGGAGVKVLNLGDRPLRRHGRSVAKGALQDAAPGLAPAAPPSLAPAAAADADGNLFVIDAYGQRIVHVDTAGETTPLVGTGSPQPELACCVSMGIAAEPDGNLYFNTWLPPRVWYMNRGPTPATVHGQTVAPNSIQPVAGTGVYGFEGDGGPAVEAQLQRPVGMALDGRGNLYLADGAENTVRKIDPAGTITTIAGTGAPGFNGNGLKATATTFSSPSSLAFDRCGNLLIADQVNDRVRRLNLVGPCGPAGSSSGRGGGAGRQGLRLIPLMVLAGGLVVVLVRRWRRVTPPPEPRS